MMSLIQALLPDVGNNHFVKAGLAGLTLRRRWGRSPAFLRPGVGRHISAAEWVSITIIALCGAFLRFHNLGQNELWLDEAYTWLFALHTTGGILGRISLEETNPPLLYLLLHFLTGRMGDSEWMMRMPSAVAASLHVPLVYLIGRRFVSKEAALYAGVLLAASSGELFYAQEARAYAIVSLLDAIAAFGLFEALSKYTHRNTLTGSPVHGWVIFVLAATASIYAHYTSTFFVASCGVAAAIYGLKSGKLRFCTHLLLSSAVIGAGSFWALYLMWALSQSALISWIIKPDISSALRLIIDTYGFSHFYMFAPMGSIAIPALGCMGALLLSKRNQFIMVSWLVVAIFLAMLFTISQTSSPVFNARTIYPALFLVMLLCGALLAAIPFPFARIFLFASLTMVGICSCLNYFKKPHSSDHFKEVTGFIGASLLPDEAVLAGPGVLYYRNHLNLEFPMYVAVPGFSSLDDRPGAKSVPDPTRLSASPEFSSLLVVMSPEDDPAQLTAPRMHNPVLIFQAGRNKVFRVALYPDTQAPQVSP